MNIAIITSKGLKSGYQAGKPYIADTKSCDIMAFLLLVERLIFRMTRLIFRHYLLHFLDDSHIIISK